VPLARLWELASEVLDQTSRNGVGGVGGSRGGLAEVRDLFHDSTSMRVKIAVVIARRGGNMPDLCGGEDPHPVESRV
jgi:hypothetical protein